MIVVGPDGTHWPKDSLRGIENASIRAFVESCAEHFTGRVLDYGAGRMPYRSVIERAGGHYEPFDMAHYPANVSGEDVGEELFWDANAWDAILCTQVAQYVPCEEMHDFVGTLHHHLFRGGVLVMTYPTHWPEVEPEDLHRFTKAGMERLLKDAGFTIERHERRAELVNRDGTFALGYGLVARV